MPIRGLISHIDLNVSDPSASIPFYALVLEALGFQRFWVEPSEGRDNFEEIAPTDRCAWWALYESGAVLNIEIRPPQEPVSRSHHERYAPGLDHLAFHASSRDDVDVFYATLRNAGIDVADPPREHGSPNYYAIGFDDPDGIHLEVVYETSTNP